MSQDKSKQVSLREMLEREHRSLFSQLQPGQYHLRGQCVTCDYLKPRKSR